MHHLTCGISSHLHSVNLILFTLLLVHLILRISSYHSRHLRSHHLSFPQSFTADLNLASFTNPFLHNLLIPSEQTSRIFNLYTELSGHWRLFVLVLCVRLSGSHSALKSTLNSCILSYHRLKHHCSNISGCHLLPDIV